MPGMTSEDQPQTPGANASLGFGKATEMDRERKAVESAGSPAQQPPGAQPPPGQPPPQPQQGSVPPAAFAPVQPSPMVPQAIDGQLNLGGVFQQAPVLREPWRTWLRSAGGRPGAGPEMRLLKDSIDHQRGPLDEPPRGMSRG